MHRLGSDSWDSGKNGGGPRWYYLVLGREYGIFGIWSSDSGFCILLWTVWRLARFPERGPCVHSQPRGVVGCWAGKNVRKWENAERCKAFFGKENIFMFREPYNSDGIYPFRRLCL